MLALHLSPICVQMHGCAILAGGACTSINERLCASLRHRLHICRCAAAHFAYGCTHMCMAARLVFGRLHMRICAVVRFVLESLVHMQMYGCALRRGIARTYADARLCASPWSARTCADARLRDSSQNRLHICRCAVVRFVTEPLAHMQMHGRALRRWIARTYADAWLCASSLDRSHICIRTAARSIAWRLYDRWRAHKSSTFR